MAINKLTGHLSALCSPLSPRLGCQLNTLFAVAPRHLKVNISKNGPLIFTCPSFSPTQPLPKLPISAMTPLVQEKNPGVILDSSLPSPATPSTHLFCWLYLQNASPYKTLSPLTWVIAWHLLGFTPWALVSTWQPEGSLHSPAETPQWFPLKVKPRFLPMAQKALHGLALPTPPMNTPHLLLLLTVLLSC